MRKDKQQATVLRQSGMSYSDIKETMAIPRSTLSKWFRGQKWSNNIAIKNAQKAKNAAAMRFTVLNVVRGGRLKKIYADANQDAVVDFTELKYHPLFMAGVMAYWSHGDKTSKHKVSLTNMSPAVIKIFRLFLENICSVNTMRTQLFLTHDFGKEDEIKLFWVEKAGISADSFLKTLHGKLIVPKKPSNKPYFGVCNLIVNSAYLKNKILKWMELLIEEIGEEKYEIDAGILRLPAAPGYNV